MNRQEFTASLKIEAEIGRASESIDRLSEQISKMWSHGTAPKSLLTSIENVKERLASLKTFTEKDYLNRDELKQAKSDYKAIAKELHDLQTDFKLLSAEQKRSLLDPEVKEQLEARTKAMKEYEREIARVTAHSEKLARVQADLKAKQDELKTKKSSLPALSEKAQKVSKYKTLKLDSDSMGQKIQTMRQSGKFKEGEGRDNQLTRAIAEKQKIDAQITTLGLDAKAIKEGEVEIAKVAETTKTTTTQIEALEKRIEELNNEFADLSASAPTTQSLEAIKKKMSELGVTGLDDIQTVSQLKEKLKGLENIELAKLQNQIDSIGDISKQTEVEIQKMGDSIRGATDEIKAQDDAVASQEAFNSRIKQFIGLKGAAELMRRALHNAFETIKDLDAAMTEMAVVTDTDISGYWEQLPQYTQRANELGLAIRDVYEADTLFYQQGLSTQQVVEISTQTMKMARVANLATAEATDRMTAALRGFNMELNETNAQKVADVYSELAAITASDVDEISSAMTKTASIASNAGMEFETTAAFLSQIIETTRETAETAGTAMKTVIARFQELKKDPAEIGEVDGEIVDANKIETALRSVGVALRDSSGQFRDLDDVFMELSAKWDTLDTNTQRYIATIAAGSRQQSRFIAMMSDYDRTVNLVNAANNSAGASNEQFEKTMESLSAKLNELKNAWDSFTMGFLESDVIKGLVEALTRLITILDKASQGIEGFGGTISKLGMVFTVFKAGQILYEKFLLNLVSKFKTAGMAAGEGFKQALGDSFSQVGSTTKSGAAKQVSATYQARKEDKAKKPETDKKQSSTKPNASATKKEARPSKLERLKAEQSTEQLKQSVLPTQIDQSVSDIKQEFSEKMSALEVGQEQIDQAWDAYAAEIKEGGEKTSKAIDGLNAELIKAGRSYGQRTSASGDKAKNQALAGAAKRAERGETAKNKYDSMVRMETGARKAELIQGNVQRIQKAKEKEKQLAPQIAKQERFESIRNKTATATGFEAIGKAKKKRQEAQVSYKEAEEKSTKATATVTNNTSQIEKVFKAKFADLGGDAQAADAIWAKQASAISAGGESGKSALAALDQELAKLSGEASQSEATEEPEVERAANTIKETIENATDRVVNAITGTETPPTQEGPSSIEPTEDAIQDDATITPTGSITEASVSAQPIATAQPVPGVGATTQPEISIAMPDTEKANKDITELAKSTKKLTDESKKASTATKAFSAEETKAGKATDKTEDAVKKANETRSKGENILETFSEQMDENASANEDFTEAEGEKTQAIKKAEEASAEEEQGMKKMTNTIAGVGAAMTGMGLAASGVGSMLEQMGLQEAADAAYGLGSILTTVGSVISMVSGVMGIVQALMGPAIASSGALTAAKTAESGGWMATGVSALFAQGCMWPVLVITLAIIAAIAILVVLFIVFSKAMEKVKAASPEGELKAAEEAADKAAEAAENAAEAYEHLKNSLEDLDGKYKALEDLTRGTKEWNQAVRDINSSVIELIDKYPELAKFVENEAGVLTIDVESDEVQGVLKEAEAEKIMAANESAMASAAVSKASATKAMMDNEAITKIANQRLAGELAVDYATSVSGMVTAGIGTVMGIGNAIYHAATAQDRTKGDEQLQQAIGGLAESVSSGEIEADYDAMVNELVNTYGIAESEAAILAEQFANNTDELYSFGESLNAAELQQKAVYDSIAASAQNMADTMDFSADQLQQSAVMVDGDTTEAFYQAEMDRLADVDYMDKNLSDADRAEAEAALREKYGESARLTEDGKVVYNDGTKDQEITLTNEEIKTMIATRNATEKSAEAIEASKVALEKLGKSLGDTNGELIDNMFSATEGQNLTQADVEKLKSDFGLGADFDSAAWLKKTDDQKSEFYDSNESLKQLWKDLGAEGQKAYAGDYKIFAEQMMDMVATADDAFDKAGDVVRGYMTSGQAKAYDEKLEAVANKEGGQEASAEIQAATDALMNQLLDSSMEKQQEIQNRINMTDWSSLEELTALQIDLQAKYGYTAEQAQAYIDTLSKAAYATSTLTLTLEAYGDLYQANDAVSRSLRTIANLQWEYNQAIRDGEGAIAEFLTKQVEEYQKMGAEYENAYNASTVNLQKILGQGMDETKFGGYDLTDFITVREDGSLDTSVGSSGMGLQDLYATADPATKTAIEEWLNSYNDEWGKQQEAYEGLQSTVEDIQALEEQGKEAYYELRDMAKESILGALEREIDLQQQTLDATKDANSQLISKIQEQIDDSRQARENAQMEEDIANMESQQAYLMADTSGAGTLEAKQLGSKIDEAKQDYEDKLIDQTIQSLQDANEQAAEQRERQISLAEQQLESYRTSAELQQKTDSMLEEMIAAGDNWRETELGELMYDQYTAGLSTLEINDWANSIAGKIGNVDTWKKTDWGTATTDITDAIKELPSGLQEAIVSGASDKANRDTATALQGQGYSKALEAAGIKIDSKTGAVSGSGENGALTQEDETRLKNIQDFAARDQEGASSAKTTYESIQSSDYMTARTEALGEDAKIMSSEEYYAANAEKIAKGEKVETYSAYISKVAEDKKEYEEQQKYDTQGAIGAAGEGFDDKKDAWFDLILYGDGGKELIRDNLVETGSAASDQSALTELWDNTKGEGMGDSFQCVLYGEGSDASLYVRKKSGTWWEVLDQGANLSSNYDNRPQNAISKALEYRKTHGSTNYQFQKFETGGLADFTGPAWLDGTKSHPELVLNQRDTANFIQLKDILAEVMDRSSGQSTKSSNGDNYFDIEINVESLENDYDVEQLAGKIRSMIYDDASYRNVNAINKIR